MGYELDFLGVGENSNSGDAIAIRYGNLHGTRDEQTVIVIDGGFKAYGQPLVDHIKRYYGTTKVDLVISTHPDQDHINGLVTVIDQLDVSQLWIHKPWEHNAGLADKFHDGRITDNSIAERLRKNLNAAYDLVRLAESNGVAITEPYTGTAFEAVTVLGPTVGYYEELLPRFDGMPDTKAVDESVAASRFDVLLKAGKKALIKVFASWGEDKVNDDDTTSAKNNSSVITQIVVDGKRLLFTGDAGITALDQAADQLGGYGPGDELRFIQIPHHGSKRNVGPAVLNRLIGSPVAPDESRPITALASSAKEGEPKHPHKAVLNAFTHRGVKTLATRGISICHSCDRPKREGWSSMAAEPFYDTYEDEA